MKKLISLLPLLLIAVGAAAQGRINPQVVKTTFEYASKPTQTLYMDRYELPMQHSLSMKKPVFIFMFGGGFVTGVKDREDYIPFYHYLAEQGYVVAAIDYRLGFKDYRPDSSVTPNEFISVFDNTVNMAVEDLYDATRFIIDNADGWGVDTSKIVICGSSAGGVTVLQAEFDVCKGTMFSERLPEGFNYAGVISFAGAIFKFCTDLEWHCQPCPIMMFHGDADNRVPYGKISEMGMGFFGSEYIAQTLRDMNYPYWLYIYENISHEMASLPFKQNLNEIMTFLHDFVMGGKPLMIDTKVTEIGRPVLGKEIPIMEYVRTNFENR